jgi:hypothetical protein
MQVWCKMPRVMARSWKNLGLIESFMRALLWVAVAETEERNRSRDACPLQRSTFPASVHWCTQPRLNRPRHELFVADSGVRQRSRQPTFCVRAVTLFTFTSPPRFNMRDWIDSRSRPRAGYRPMPQQAEDLRSGESLNRRTGMGVGDPHCREVIVERHHPALLGVGYPDRLR